MFGRMDGVSKNIKIADYILYAKKNYEGGKKNIYPKKDENNLDRTINGWMDGWMEGWSDGVLKNIKIVDYILYAQKHYEGGWRWMDGWMEC
jgi:hypothetical protein